MPKDFPAPYFPHDYNSRGDERLVHLISKKGWGGYGLYWALVEKMHEAGGELNLDYESIAFDLRTQCDVIKTIICDFELFKMSKCGKKFFSERVKKNLSERIIKSEKARLSARKRWGYDNVKDNANALPAQCEGNAIKERKGKERKIKHISASENADILKSFESIWKLYPRPIGRKDALRHFASSVKTPQDVDDINKALGNYKRELLKRGVKDEFIKHGSTWFNNWRDYLNEPGHDDPNHIPDEWRTKN